MTVLGQNAIQSLPSNKLRFKRGGESRSLEFSSSHGPILPGPSCPHPFRNRVQSHRCLPFFLGVEDPSVDPSDGRLPCGLS